MSVADLNGIKDQLKIIFDGANTTTASPIDLSSGMSKRVLKVLTVNPDLIKPQASFYNFVTCYIKDKNIVRDSISGTQLAAKRESDVSIEIVGAVFNQNFTDVTKDPADNDINYLMENIEQVLRSNPTLNSTVKWQAPQSVSYFSSNLNQNNNVRVGILTLSAKVFY